MGGGGLLEREGRVDDRLALALRQQRPDLGFQLLRDESLLRRRARAQRRAGMRQPLGAQRTQVEAGDLVALHEGDLHDAPFHRRHLVIALHIGAADHVENDVGSLAPGEAHHLRHEILLAVIDGMIGAEAQAGVAFVLRAGGDDDRRAKRLAEHDCRRADARRAAMDQQRLSGGQMSALEDIGPDGEEGFGHGCRLDHAKPCGDRQRIAFMGEAEARIAAAGHQGADRVAGRVARGPRAAGDHDSRDLEPGNILRRAGRRRIFALPLRDIGPVHAGGLHRDQDLPVAWHGDRALRGDKDLGAAGRGDHDGGHGCGQGAHGGPHVASIFVTL